MNRDIQGVPTNAAAGLLAGEELANQKHTLEAKVYRVGDDPAAIPYRINQNGAIEQLENLLAVPVARRAAVVLGTASSFVAYVNRFKNATSLVFADTMTEDVFEFVAVLDYHHEGAEGAAGRGKHRAKLRLLATRQWVTWTEKDGEVMNQTEFARFLEDNIPDIAAPDGAHIVEIARTLEAKKAVQFESHIREQDGSHRFAYREDVQGSAKNGSFEIPDEFLLALSPFEGGAQYKVVAKLRYRIESGGRLAMWFDLMNLDKIVEDAFAEQREKIEMAVDPTPVLDGRAPDLQ